MKAIVTVIGKDTVGIIAAVSSFLAESGVNILDISQTIMGDTFTMIMMIDEQASSITHQALIAGLNAIGENKGVSIAVQSEKIFNSMHRI